MSANVLSKPIESLQKHAPESADTCLAQDVLEPFLIGASVAVERAGAS